MALWVIFAILTAAAAVAILRPLWRARPPAPASSGDLEVYKQQLREIDDESERGLLGKTEADAARIEISRRILAAADRPAASTTESKRAAVPYVMVAVLPVVALALYTIYGSPNLPGQPFSARLPSDVNSIEAMVARVEERLDRHP